MAFFRRTLPIVALLVSAGCKETPTSQPTPDKGAGSATPPAGASKDIKVGGLFDLTGVTSDVGKSYAKGVHDCVQAVNAKGGINGKKIDLKEVDYGYKIPEAVAA